jgi:hypothetical protein
MTLYCDRLVCCSFGETGCFCLQDEVSIQYAYIPIMRQSVIHNPIGGRVANMEMEWDIGHL